MTDIVERLRERLALRYMGDCKCGKCQLVPGEDVAQAADEIERLREALRGLACWCDENECQEHDDVGLRYCCYRNEARAALGEGKG